MDAETQLQIEHLQELRVHHERRKHVLELQSAQLGRATPPEVRTEIEDIDGKLREIDKSITKLLVAQQADVLRAVEQPGGSGEWAPFWRYVTQLEDRMLKEFKGIYLFIDERIGADGKTRDRRQYRTDVYRAVVLVLLVAIFLAVGVLVFIMLKGTT